jgi:hypothetical protein
MATLADIKTARDAYLTAKAVRALLPVGNDAWCKAADAFIVAREDMLRVARTFTAENAPAYRAADMDRPYAIALGDGVPFSARIRGEVIDLLLSMNCDEE